MSYREEGNSVILTMSREDYEQLHHEVTYSAYRYPDGPETIRHKILVLWDRLNSGNPNYTPYQVEEKKS